MFGYEYVSLEPEQVNARRLLLDQAGLHGYLLPIAVLSTLYIVRSVSKLTGTQSSGSSDKPNSLQLYCRRLDWVLGNTYTAEFGPLHVQVLGLLYVSVLLYIIVKGTGNDYMHVTKAFGHVAVSQLPVHYLLSIKHPQSPITLATGLTHERLNAYHRLFGRIIHTLLATHAILYIKFFIDINVLWKRIQDWDVRYGLTAFWTMNFIGLLSIPPLRQKVYHKVFYRSHVVLTLLLAIIVWLHVPYTRNYVAQAAFFWLTNGYLRKGKMAESAVVKCTKAGGGLVRVIATLKDGASWDSWVPGMHGYLNQGGLGPRTPFTVTDAHVKDGNVTVEFVVRDLGGPMTGALSRAATQNKPLSGLEIEGPYGEAKEYMPDVIRQTQQPVLVVAGGVGATYALPIYLALAEKRASTSDLRLIWIVKHADDAKWGMDMLRGKANRDVQLFITQGKDEGNTLSALSLPGVRTSTSRPDLATVVDSFLKKSNVGQPVTIMVCGPTGLSADVRKAVGKHVQAGRRVQWFEEQFGFGGS